MALSAGEIEVLLKMKVEGEEQVRKATEALKGIKAPAEDSSKGVGLLGSSFTKLAASFAVANLVASATTALIGFAKESLATAGHLTDMAAKTGLSVESLQRMKFAAEQTGSSVDAFAQAAFMLGVNLEKGTKTTASAVDRLGLSYSELIALAPDQQFEKIASALGRVADPQERNRLAMELFGRSAKEILPAIAEGYDDMASHATVASKESIAALDRLGDALSKGKGAVAAYAMSWTGELAKVAFRITELRTLQGIGGGQFAVNPNVSGPAAIKTIKDLGLSTEELDRITKELTASAEKDIAAKEKQAAASTKLIEQTKQVNDAFRASVRYFNEADDGMEQLRQTVVPFVGELEELASTSAWVAKTFEQFKAPIKGIVPLVDTLGQSIKSGLMNVLKDVPQTIANAFTGGGSKLGAFSAIGTQIGATIGNSIGASFKALGSLGGPIGSAIGSLVGVAVSWIGGLFGRAERARKEAFAKAAAAAKQAAAEAAAALEKLLGDMRSQVETFQSDLDGLLGRARDLGYVFDATGNLVSVSWEKMAATAEKYGVVQAELGPAFQQLRLHDVALEIINDFTLLQQGGMDTGAILNALGPTMNTLVQESRKFGTTIPANMKPWIEALLVAGFLVDENGDKLTDLSQVKFGDPVKTEFEKISTAIVDLIAKIADLVAKIDELMKPKSTTLTINPVFGPMPSEMPAPDTSPGFAGGTYGTTGSWFGSFGAGTPVTLHGEEAVVRRDQAGAFAAAYGSEDTALMEVRRLMRALPTMMKTALKDALVLGT